MGNKKFFFRCFKNNLFIFVDCKNEKLIFGRYLYIPCTLSLLQMKPLVAAAISFASLFHLILPFCRLIYTRIFLFHSKAIIVASLSGRHYPELQMVLRWDLHEGGGGGGCLQQLLSLPYLFVVHLLFSVYQCGTLCDICVR